MSIIEQLQTKAKAIGATVVLPEGDDPRIIQAATLLSQAGIVQPIILGQPDQIQQLATESGIALPVSVTLIDPATADQHQSFTDQLYAMQKDKGVTREQAEARVKEPLTFAAMLIRTGAVDGCVAGAVNSTRDVLRAGLHIIGLAEGIEVVSSTFLMVLPDGRALTFGDCGVVPYPDAKQLAQIAVASAHTHQQLTGETPVVAMLSFSTKGIARHDAVTKVQEATALAQQMAPELAIDGELQFDAAFVDAVGQKKAPGSSVAGKANVFIFPNLDAGNIGYKLTERLAKADALGPIIQGLARPMHDLSRGCKAEDIVTMSAIAALQSQI
ncbi:MAG: phosphate acetyltransferase [Chloroflexota bacterium]